MMGKEVHYELIDDGGSNALYLPILMPINTNFFHEFGTYKIIRHDIDDKGDPIILCERISTRVHPYLQ